MPEPVDPEADFLAVVGDRKTVSVRNYLTASDTHDTAQSCSGVRMPRRVETAMVGDGEVRVTRATWYLAGGMLSARPPMKSLVVDGLETWIIDSIGPDARDAVLVCQCTLSG